MKRNHNYDKTTPSSPKSSLIDAEFKCPIAKSLNPERLNLLQQLKGTIYRRDSFCDTNNKFNLPRAVNSIGHKLSFTQTFIWS